jgi:uncharacterized protein (DUF2236 family)
MLEVVAMLDERCVTWRYAGDARILPFLGRAFLLQAAHPTIAAGVADHSNFKVDPFGRFQQSYGLVLKALYAADGDQVAAGVRATHKQIKGVMPDGRHYHAYEPEAYFWVLATGHETFVSVAQRFLRPMTRPEERRAYDEMRELGLRFGLRDRDMPATLEQFEEWYAWMLAERIEDSQTVRDVLATVRRPNPPKGVPRVAWPLPRELAAHLAWLTTVGTLTPSARDRLSISWGPVQERELEAIARVFRRLARLPAPWFYLPPAREAFARASRPPAGRLQMVGEDRIAA